MPTEDDLRLVKEFTLLPVLLDSLDRDIAELERQQLKFLAMYIKTLRHVQDQVLRDLAELRGSLKRRGIRVYEQRRTRLGLESEYWCRGYRRTCSMLWGYVRAELEIRWCNYLNLGATSS